MSTKALTGLKPEWFTPSDQRPALEDPELPESEDNPMIEVEDPTRYKVKALDGIAFMEVAAHGEALFDGTFLPDHSGRLLLLHGGLKEWENLDDPDIRKLFDHTTTVGGGK